VVAKMLEMAAVGPKDHVIDLGTGDGRILLAAARERGASGEGVDLDQVLIRRAEEQAREDGLAERVSFRVEDLFRTPLGRASVLTMFLLPEVNLRLRQRILEQMRPGSRVVSHAFDMGEWQPDESGRAGGSRVYLWIVPANVAGRWRLTHDDGSTAELALKQDFQFFDGVAVRGELSRPIAQGTLRGAATSFVADAGHGEQLYQGTIRGDTIVAAPPQGWRAERMTP
jgi:Methyltransferase domain